MMVAAEFTSYCFEMNKQLKGRLQRGRNTERGNFGHLWTVTLGFLQQRILLFDVVVFLLEYDDDVIQTQF